MAVKIVDVDHSATVGLDLLGSVTCNGGAGGVRAVSRIGDEDRLTPIASGVQKSADKQKACELPVRSRGRLQRHSVHAGDFGQKLFQ